MTKKGFTNKKCTFSFVTKKFKIQYAWDHLEIITKLYDIFGNINKKVEVKMMYLKTFNK